ncbi:MAG: hypothetical protein WBZ42_02915 [Halobacteriota archaeon]
MNETDQKILKRQRDLWGGSGRDHATDLEHDLDAFIDCINRYGGERMIETGLILTGSDAELLSRALSEVKTKVYEESEARLEDTQALEALVSCFRNAEKEGQEKERPHMYFSPLRKRLVLGTIISRQGGVEGR